MRFRCWRPTALPGNAGLPVLLVWTTTPWTLISNVAARCGPDIEYARVRVGDEYFVLAADLARPCSAATPWWSETSPAPRWSGRHYEPPYQFVAPRAGPRYVVGADYVATDEGTGIVHIAPAFGADDMIVGSSQRSAGDQPGRHGGALHDEVALDGHVRQGRRRRPSWTTWSAACCGARRPTSTTTPICWRCDTPLHLLRQGGMVHPDHGLKEQLLAANEEVDWHPDAHQARPFRQVAGEQHRLVALARALLGHAAAGLALRARPRPRWWAACAELRERR